MSKLYDSLYDKAFEVVFDVSLIEICSLMSVNTRLWKFIINNVNIYKI